MPRGGGGGGGSRDQLRTSISANGIGYGMENTSCPRDAARTDPDAQNSRQDAALTYGGALRSEQHGDGSRSVRLKEQHGDGSRSGRPKK